MFVAITFIAMIFINPAAISDSVINSIIFCLFRLIPSVFPMMVICSVISRSLYVRNKEKSGRFLGVERSVFPTVASSWLSGYIVGPYILNESNERTDITSYALLTTNAGVGFVVIYVGCSVWNSLIYGMLLYLFQIMISQLMFLVSDRKRYVHVNTESTDIISNITSSISKCTYSVLQMCGFTVFFGVILKIFSILMNLKPHSFGLGILASVLDICSGIECSVTHTNTLICAFFTGFSVGFGGICICLQTFSVCNKNTIRKGNFIFKKLIQGLLCGIFSTIIVKLSDVKLDKQVILNKNQNTTAFVIFALTVFFVSFIYSVKKSLKAKQI